MTFEKLPEYTTKEVIGLVEYFYMPFIAVTDVLSPEDIVSMNSVSYYIAWKNILKSNFTKCYYYYLYYHFHSIIIKYVLKNIIPGTGSSVKLHGIRDSTIVTTLSEFPKS